MTFAELQTAVAEQQLGNAKLTDIKTGTYSLVLGATKEDPCHLIGSKKEKYPISVRSLAAMRIVTDASKVALAKTTREARDNDAFSTLQKSIVDDSLPVTEATKFNVVGHLKIQDVVTEEPVYKNEHYVGYPIYVKASRKAANLPRKTEDERTIRNAAFTEATDNLRASGVNKGAKAPKDEPNSYIMMPVFTVTN
jgi:hypothetical protein